jgi:predicted GNAT family N-acyltransferase
MSEVLRTQNEASVIGQPVVFRGEDDPALLERIEALRLDVWGELIGAELAVKRFGLDPFDNKAWHIAYLEEGDVVASSRLIIASCQSDVPDLCSFGPYLDLMEYPIGVLNRLLVDRMYRGRGMAPSLIRARIRLAHEHGVTDLWAESQSHTVPSMEQHGFREVGPSLDKSVVGDWRIMRRNT